MQAYDEIHPLPKALINKLQNEAKKYNLIVKAKDKKEWYFGKLITDMWQSAGDDIHAELTFEQYCMEASRVMNEVLPFPMFAESGTTLRRWANMHEFWKDKDIADYKLSYDHFFRAKRLNFNGITEWKDALDWASGKNHDKEKKSAEDMEYHFNPPEKVTPYEKFTGWLSSFPVINWLSKRDEERVQEIKSELQEIVKRNL